MKRIILISLIVSFTSFAFGQEIQFKTGNTIRTIQHWNVEKIKESFAEKETSLTARTRFSEETDYYWIAFKDVINNVLKAKLDFLGVEIIGYAGTFPEGRLYKINVNGRYKDVFDILKQEETFINLIPVWLEEKIDKNILENRNLTYVDSVLKTIKATIYFYKPMEKEEIEHLLGNSVDTIIFDDANEKVVHIVSTRNELLRIAKIDHVKRVSEYQKKLPLNSHARELTKVNKLQEEFITITHPPTTDWLAGVPYTGDGIWICINEYIDAFHLDFHEKLPGGGTQVRKSHPNEKLDSDLIWAHEGHGTHVAGIAAGNGWNSLLASLIPGGMLQWRGVAPKALLSSIGEKGDVNNHSFTESRSGYYDHYSSAAETDESLSNHEGTGPSDNNISIWSAANNGVTSGPESGVQRGYYSMLVNSKNGIKVGATKKDKALKAEFSSMGPTRDGRIGPDICAPGDGFAEHESWDIQIDYIAIENNGTTKHRWDFDSDHPEWGTEWRIDNLVQNNGILSFSTSHGGYFSSNDLISPPFQSEDGDELVFYWKVIQTSSAYSIETMKCVIYWKRPDDSYYKRNYNIDNNSYDYATVAFTFQRTGDWQETRICLNDPRWDITEGGWVGGDEIQRLRLDFHSASPHMGIVSCYYDDDDEKCGTTNDYVSWNGTSMSAPHVTGIVALMLQKYRDEVLVPLGRGLNIHDNPFWNSTAKAILIHTATDLVSTAGEGFILDNNPDFASQGFHQPEIYGPGPDFATGYGLVNAVKALEYVDTDKFVEDTIDQYETKSYLFSVPPGTKNFRVTLAWDDPPYVGDNSESGAYNIKLVNDIDLYLTNVNSGEIIRPWVLDHSMLNNRTVAYDGLDPITPCDISDNPAYKGIDNRNNVEVVDVEWPDVGLWAIVVKGAKIAQDQSGAPGINQDISLVLDFPIFTTPPITATVQGSQTPEVKDPPCAMVINEDFTITPGVFDPGRTLPLGDGINERTSWSFDFAEDPEFQFFSTSFPLASALLTLELTPKSSPSTDTFTIGGVSPIITPEIQMLSIGVPSTIQIELTNFYHNMALPYILKALHGSIPAFYADDAIVSFAELTLTSFPGEKVNDRFPDLGPEDVDTDFDVTPCAENCVGTFTITAEFKNTSSDTLSDLFFEVVCLTGGNVLCNADGGIPWGNGADLTVPMDGVLKPWDTFVVEFKIGLASFDPFAFEVDLFGKVQK